MPEASPAEGIRRDGTVLGFDVGARRIGVAVGSAFGHGAREAEARLADTDDERIAGLADFQRRSVGQTERTQQIARIVIEARRDQTCRSAWRQENQRDGPGLEFVVRARGHRPVSVDSRIHSLFPRYLDSSVTAAPAPAAAPARPRSGERWSGP